MISNEVVFRNPLSGEAVNGQPRPEWEPTASTMERIWSAMLSVLVGMASSPAGDGADSRAGIHHPS